MFALLPLLLLLLLHVQVELVLTESDYTLKMWPYKFKAVRLCLQHSDGLE